MRRKLIRKFKRLYEQKYVSHVIPMLQWKVRHKRHIRVLFIVCDLSTWKSELLFREMMKHPKFRPIILACPSSEQDECAKIEAVAKERGYEYRRVDNVEGLDLQHEFHPDIILYPKPYDGTVAPNLRFEKNLKSLFCFVNYGFHGVDEKWSRNTSMLNNCWQVYYENRITMESSAPLMDNKGCNLMLTGLPVQDELMAPAQCDPWKKCETPKKRVIWAPHHSIDPENWIHYATFLEYAELFPKLARKYPEVQWAFKPHPLLRPKLDKLWGKERTDAYYSMWDTMPNTQLSDGKYYDLFKHSDALIHDCGSFTVEYMYTGKPALYLKAGEHVTDGLNKFQRKAFDCHYIASDADAIEVFIKDIVIAGADPLVKERSEFYKGYLIPPYGNSACHNIVNAILGKK